MGSGGTYGSTSTISGGGFGFSSSNPNPNNRKFPSKTVSINTFDISLTCDIFRDLQRFSDSQTN